MLDLSKYNISQMRRWCAALGYNLSGFSVGNYDGQLVHKGLHKQPLVSLNIHDKIVFLIFASSEFLLQEDFTNMELDP